MNFINVILFFIKLSNRFVFPDPEAPIIKILYGWSGIYGHILLCSLLFWFVILSRLNIKKKKVKSHPSVVDYFKKLPFYKKRIEKPKIKRLKDIDLLSELPFYEELNVIKTNHAFQRNAISYKVQLVEKKDPIKQLEAIKSSIKDLFNNLLHETKVLSTK